MGAFLNVFELRSLYFMTAVVLVLEYFNGRCFLIVYAEHIFLKELRHNISFCFVLFFFLLRTKLSSY